MLWGRRGLRAGEAELPEGEGGRPAGVFGRLTERIRGLISPVGRRIRGERGPPEEEAADESEEA